MISFTDAKDLLSKHSLTFVTFMHFLVLCSLVTPNITKKLLSFFYKFIPTTITVYFNHTGVSEQEVIHIFLDFMCIYGLLVIIGIAHYFYIHVWPFKKNLNAELAIIAKISVIWSIFQIIGIVWIDCLIIWYCLFSSTSFISLILNLPMTFNSFFSIFSLFSCSLFGLLMPTYIVTSKKK